LISHPRPLLPLLLLIAAWAWAPAGAHARDRVRLAEAKAEQKAREHVRKGAEAFRDGRYDAAMAEFEAGYAADPRPGFLLNMGHVQRKAGNPARARGYYRQYLDRDPASPQRAEVEKAIAEIDASAKPAQARNVAVAVATPTQDAEVPADLKLRNPEAVVRRDSPAPAATAETDTPFYRSWWFWGTAGGVVVAGVVGFLLLRPQDGGYTMSGTWGTLGK
jgi:tetratricopeptide (TPR) repeat protein